MTAVEVYRAPTGQDIRTVLRDGEPWFVAADVCAALGISNSRDAVSRLDSAEKGVGETDTPGGLQSVTIVSEAGLYRLVMRSNRPDAVRFQMWIAHDVLPAIRRTGGYTATPALPQTYAAALRELASTVEERDAALEHVAELEPRANLADRVLDASGDYSVADAAKVLSRDPAITTGRDRLFTILSDLGWTYRQRSDQRWRPKQYAVERRWLSELAASHYHPRTGELVLDAPQMRVTPKVLLELHGKLGGTAPLAVQPSLLAVGAA